MRCVFRRLSGRLHTLQNRTGFGAFKFVMFSGREVLA